MIRQNGQPARYSGLASALALIAALLFSHTVCAIPRNSSDHRPYRAGIIRIAPGLDHKKPLGVADYAGVTEASGLIISAVDSQWVAGFRRPSMTPAWWLKTTAGLTVPPTVFGNWGVLGLRNGELIKFNAQNGRKEWSLQLETFVARRVIRSGNILIAVTASQSVYAIDYQTGKVLWVQDESSPDGIAIRTLAPPVIHNKTLYLGLSSGEITAVGLEDGKKKWTHSPAPGGGRFHDVVGEMYVLDKNLIVSKYDGLIAAINLENHLKPVPGWETPKKFNTITANAFRHGRLYVGTHNGFVYALNPRTGQQLWQTNTGTSIASVTAGETRLYVAGSLGRVSALDNQTGTVYWHDQLEGRISSQPVYLGKNLYFSTGLKVMYGYRLR